MDFGSRAPAAAFTALFAREGVPVSEAEARVPMGAHKRDHIAAILGDPQIAERWRARHGSLPNADALNRLYRQFSALQVEVLNRHLDLLPGVAETAATLRARGIRFASTTGFDSTMIGALIDAAHDQGYEPECWVTPDLTGGGRPAPWMIYHAARQMNVYPLATFVKVGDTPLDIEEARNAGTWAVSVVATGNEIGLSQTELNALPEAERLRRFAAAREKFLALGAHYTIDYASGLMPVIAEISRRIEQGERP